MQKPIIMAFYRCIHAALLVLLTLLVQPYYGAHAPLPGNDRQITLGARLGL